jgi:tetratricopeptide (TPR) repeat protein
MRASAPRRRRAAITSSARKISKAIALRCFGAAGGLALGLVGALSSAQAETTPACVEGALPVETLGDAKEQRQALFLQAKACMAERKPLRAVALLTQIIKADPTNAFAYLNRGGAEASAGEVTLAISDFSVAIGLKPDLVEAWYDRGTTLTHMRRFESAIADFTEAIRLKPDLALAYCNRGLANFQLSHYDEALVDYSIAIERDPKLTYCFLNRGSLYLTLGDYQKAIDDLSEALSEKPGNPIALTKRGQAHEALGEKAQALDDFRAALGTDAGLESAKEGFARIMTEQQRSERQK